MQISLTLIVKNIPSYELPWLFAFIPQPMVIEVSNFTLWQKKKKCCNHHILVHARKSFFRDNSKKENCWVRDWASSTLLDIVKFPIPVPMPIYTLTNVRQQYRFPVSLR